MPTPAAKREIPTPDLMVELVRLRTDYEKSSALRHDANAQVIKAFAEAQKEIDHLDARVLEIEKRPTQIAEAIVDIRADLGKVIVALQGDKFGNVGLVASIHGHISACDRRHADQAKWNDATNKKLYAFSGGLAVVIFAIKVFLG